MHMATALIYHNMMDHIKMPTIKIDHNVIDHIECQQPSLIFVFPSRPFWQLDAETFGQTLEHLTSVVSMIKPKHQT